MKYRFAKTVSLFLSLLLTFSMSGINSFGAENTSSASSVSPLHVSGTVLKNSSGETVDLRGVSTHGLAWYPQYVNYDAFRSLRDTMHVNLIRLAVYTEEYGGYCAGGDRDALKKTIDDGVNYATELGMYVIIDWHILNDNDPNIHKDDAVAFFSEESAKYADHTNVLYEICNEPHGCSWDNAASGGSPSIKSYAETVISAIRKNSPGAVVLVGTNTWSQDVDDVINDRIADPNVMYVLHFYAGTHKEDLRNKLKTAVDAGIPVFVSEFGICDASGSGSIDYDSAAAWMSLLKENHIGYAVWNLSNKAETSALIRSDCAKLSGWSDSDWSPSGLWFKNSY